jgi:hypothetical protein
LFGAGGLCDRRLNGRLADDGLGGIGALGRKISIFVCARTPLSPGFSMLEPGVVTCPPTGDDCAWTSEAESNATINTENTKQYQWRASPPLQNLLISPLSEPRFALLISHNINSCRELRFG